MDLGDDKKKKWPILFYIKKSFPVYRFTNADSFYKQCYWNDWRHHRLQPTWQLKGNRIGNIGLDQL